jgi:hypothetical protein
MFAIAALAGGAGSAMAGAQENAAAVPEIRFDATADFLKLPANTNLGEVAGVAIDSRKHLYVFSRTGGRSTVHGAVASQLFEFGPDGSFLRRRHEHDHEVRSLGTRAHGPRAAR